MNKHFLLTVILVELFFCVSCSFPDLDRVDPGHDPSRFEEQAEQLSDQAGFLVLENIPVSDLVLCQSPEMEFVTNFSVYQTPDLPEPEPRVPINDPVFGTCLIRVTDRKNDPLNPADPSQGMKNEYARVQSFNADGSLLLVRSIESFWYVYDANSFLPLGEVPASVEPRWDARNPNLLYFTDETSLMSYDLRVGEISTVHNFGEDFPGRDLAGAWTRYEGSPSYDSRYWGLLAQNSNWDSIAFLIYDRELDRVITRGLDQSYSIDNVTISPLGNYFLASFDNYCEAGHPGSDTDPCGLMVYNSSLKNGRSLLRIIGHYDTILDPDGREMIIYQDIDTDDLAMLDLESGQITALLPIDFSHTGIGFHFSGRASGLPGWAIVSTYNGGHPQAYTWMDNTVFAVELVQNPRIVRLTQTHSVYDENIEKDYWAEPHASVNQDFTKIVFTSNWGRTGTEEVDLYLLILSEDWVEKLP